MNCWGAALLMWAWMAPELADPFDSEPRIAHVGPDHTTMEAGVARSQIVTRPRSADGQHASDLKNPFIQRPQRTPSIAAPGDRGIGGIGGIGLIDPFSAPKDDGSETRSASRDLRDPFTAGPHAQVSPPPRLEGLPDATVASDLIDPFGAQRASLESWPPPA